MGSLSLYIYMYIHMYICIPIYIYVYTYMYMYMYIGPEDNSHNVLQALWRTPKDSFWETHTKKAGSGANTCRPPRNRISHQGMTVTRPYVKKLPCDHPIDRTLRFCPNKRGVKQSKFTITVIRDCSSLASLAICKPTLWDNSLKHGWCKAYGLPKRRTSMGRTKCSSSIFYLWFHLLFFGNPGILSTPGWLYVYGYVYVYVHAKGR